MTDIPDSYVEAVRGNVCPTVEEQIKEDCTAAIADLESRLAATRDELARSYERAGHGAPVPDDLREVVADAIGWTDTDGNMTFGERAVVVLQAITAAGHDVSRPSPEEPKTPPDPIYNAVERILDEESAWVACPNNEVTMRIASDIRNKFHKTRLTKEFHYAFEPDDVYAVIEALERSSAKSHSTSTD